MSIRDFIASDSPEAADRLVTRIESSVRSLAASPTRGEAYPLFGPSCRRIIIGNYLVYYEVEENYVVALRVFHAARDIKSLDD